MKTAEAIQYEVGQWSQENFGGQETKLLKVIAVDEKGDFIKGLDGDSVQVALGSLAPLMGLMEEVGEMFEGGTPAEHKDAVGDILIYACDYCCREGIIIPYGPKAKHKFGNDAFDLDPGSGIVACLGRIFHATLKRHQRIRGYDVTDKYTDERDRYLELMLGYCERYVRQHFPNDNLLIILNQTWHGIVKKRNWKANPNATP